MIIRGPVAALFTPTVALRLSSSFLLNAVPDPFSFDRQGFLTLTTFTGGLFL